MIFSRRKVVSAILATALAMPVFTGCNNVTQSESEPSLPTVPTTTTESTIATTTTSETTEETAEPTPIESVIIRTEDGDTVIDTSYVRLIDGVKPEMMHPDYWIGEGDNEILMTDEEIAEYNRTNRGVIKAGDNKTIMPHLEDFGDTLDGNILRTFLKDNAKSVPKDFSKAYLNGKPTTKSYWDNLVALSNIDGVEDEIKVRYGFTTKRMTVRMFPTEDRIFGSSSDQFFDSLLYSECMPYMPVVILHESTDGEYLYTVFDSFSAWVRKDAIALCKDRQDWEARQNPDQWLVVTGREIRLGDDPHSPLTQDLILPMGTYMELVPAKNAPKSINQRTTYGDYIVKVPTRGKDGFIKDEYVLIPISDDVNVGFLPLTSANIVRQAFKLLGDRYGWGGDLKANDCTGITREIYRCFGVLLPRVGQSASKGVYKVDMSKMSNTEKLNVIKDLAPGSLISFPGHIMIYLGTVDEKPYVISSCGTFIAPAPGPTDIIHPRSVILNSLYVRNRSLKTWLNLSTTALTMKAAEKLEN